MGTNNGKGKSDDKGNQKSQFCDGNGGKWRTMWVRQRVAGGGRGDKGVNEKYSRDILIYRQRDTHEKRKQENHIKTRRRESSVGSC